MVQEAEKYADEDKATKERIEARNGLENYAFNLKNQVNDEEGLGGKIDEDDKESVCSPSLALPCPTHKSHTDISSLDPRSSQGNHRLARRKLLLSNIRRFRRAKGETLRHRLPNHLKTVRWSWWTRWS